MVKPYFKGPIQRGWITDITLRIYAHLFQKDDGKAAAAINVALSIS